jgi:hypothetical protein
MVFRSFQWLAFFKDIYFYFSFKGETFLRVLT